MKLNKFNKLLKEEYENTFKDVDIKIENKKRSIHKILIPVYSFVALILIALLAIGIDVVSVNNYNSGVDKFVSDYNEGLQSLSSDELLNVKTKSNFDNIIKKYNLEKKTAFINSFNSSNKGSLDISQGFPTTIPGAIMTTPSSGAPSTMSPGVSDSSSINTNTQYDDVDEADIAKCDGKYIYYCYNGVLVVYDLLGSLIGRYNTLGKIISMYVYNENIVLFYSKDLKRYVEIFNIDNDLSKAYSKEINYYDSRLHNNELFICQKIQIESEEIDYCNLYYDGYTLPSMLYEIIKINLDNLDIKSISISGNYDSYLHVTNNYISLASTNRCFNSIERYTVISVFDTDLKPVGVLKAKGYIYSQFALNEKNDVFYVVTTDTSAENCKWNQISIFDLKTLDRVGYLNEGIGLSRHTVRSVRYSGDSCFIVTYENQDPLYEIDLTDITNPKIVESLEAPGYSAYLHEFTINDTNYLLGVGYTDFNSNIKISVYKTSDNNVQIGEDYLLSHTDFYGCKIDYKAYFFYNDSNYLYFGLGSNSYESKYQILKIDVNYDSETEDVCSLYKSIEISTNTRCFYIDGNIYIPQLDGLIITAL